MLRIRHTRIHAKRKHLLSLELKGPLAQRVRGVLRAEYLFYARAALSCVHGTLVSSDVSFEPQK